jgi:anti-sigma B factor antagonist
MAAMEVLVTLNIRIELQNDVKILILQGELSLFNAGKLKETVVRLFNDGATKIILNFEEVGYIDSAGIGSLLFIFSESKKRSVRVFFTNMHGAVKKVITLTKLEKYFPILALVDDAVSQLAG